MGRIHVRIHHQDAVDTPDTELETIDVGAALIISDINLDRGTADLFEGGLSEGGRRIAHLIKRGGPHAPFWEVG